MRIRVGDCILVIFCGDHCQRIGLITIALKVLFGDLAEYPSETANSVSVFGKIGGLQQVPPDFGTGGPGHLLDTAHQHYACRTRANSLDGLMHCR